MLEPLALPRRAYFADHAVRGHNYRVARLPAAATGSPRPLLFFTGIGANIELLAPFLERLSGREVITFDLPGLGGSAPYTRFYRLAEMADVAAQIVRDLGYEEVDVMGVSWGGMLAQEFAYRHQSTAIRLVLAATSIGFPMVPEKLSSLVQMLTPQRYQGIRSIKPYLQSLYGGSTLGLEAFVARIQSPSSIGYLHQLLAILGWTSLRKLKHVTARTLILMGEDDRIVPPANGRIIELLLENSELKVLNDAGHLFLLTHLDDLVSQIETFLDDPV